MNCLIFMQLNALCLRALKLVRKRKHCHPKVLTVRFYHKLNPKSLQLSKLTISCRRHYNTNNKQRVASLLSNNISLSPPSICFLGLLMRPQVWTQAEQRRDAMGENWDAPRVWLYASSRGQTNSSMGRYESQSKFYLWKVNGKWVNALGNHRLVNADRGCGTAICKCDEVDSING